MQSFFLDYRDPLFSIIIFLTLIFVITLVSYWMNRYKQKEQSRDVDKFIKTLNTPYEKDELHSLIATHTSSSKVWLLLADMYAKRGEFQKSIEIYSELTKQPQDKERYELLFLLAQTYFRAGFLKRSKEIFLEILKERPRSVESLQALILVYEQLKEYDAALEVLVSLEMLECDVGCLGLYLECMRIIGDRSMDLKNKNEKLKEIYKSSKKLTYLIFERLFGSDPALAWSILDGSQCYKIADILWHVEPDALHCELIEQNGFLRELYTARGDVALTESSTIFEYNLLIKLGANRVASLSFDYCCSRCNYVAPFAFTRCKNCNAIDSLLPQPKLVKNFIKASHEEYHSFQ